MVDFVILIRARSEEDIFETSKQTTTLTLLRFRLVIFRH